MTQIDELVKRARRTRPEPRYKFDETISENVVYFEEVADEFHIELANALESQAAELTRLRERNAELEKERDEALPWKMFYGEGKTLGEVASHFGESIYAFSPWLTAPLARSAAESATNTFARIASLEATARELREVLNLAESVYRLNCVTIGEPSSVLDAMQAALAASESVVGKSEGEKDGE